MFCLDRRHLHLCLRNGDAVLEARNAKDAGIAAVIEVRFALAQGDKHIHVSGQAEGWQDADDRV